MGSYGDGRAAPPMPQKHWLEDRTSVHDPAYVVSGVIRRTSKAILVQMIDGSQEWFPKDHVNGSVYKDIRSGDNINILVVSQWLAVKKQLGATTVDRFDQNRYENLYWSI